jgi:thiamine monophosphate synthase
MLVFAMCDQAMKAQEDGADYVGTGAVYPTNTKVSPIASYPLPQCEATILTSSN